MHDLCAWHKTGNDDLISIGILKQQTDSNDTLNYKDCNCHDAFLPKVEGTEAIRN